MFLSQLHGATRVALRFTQATFDLKHLPVGYVKIAGSFVKDMPDDPLDRAIVQSTNHIAHLMKLGTLAGFVENDAAPDALRAFGVDYAQGHGLRRRPAPGTTISPSFPDKEACNETHDRQHSARSELHDGR